MNVLKASLIAAVTAAPLCAAAQHFTSAPATDSSTLSSPTKAATSGRTIDGATESSPELGPAPRGAASLKPGTTVEVKLDRAIDSGRLKNGETVQAKLENAVRTSSGSTLAAGTPVEVAVVETVPAGKMTAMGEFSLQVARVGSVETYTDIKTYRGQEGKRDVADSVPQLGTDAGLPAGAALSFKVQGDPTAADAAPKETAAGPGSINGTASGSAPPKSTTNSGEPIYGGGQNKTNAQPATNSPSNSFTSASHQGQAGAAANSMQPAQDGGTAVQGQTTQAR